jgi:hypothetical protein
MCFNVDNECIRGSKHDKVLQKNRPKKFRFQKQSLFNINVGKNIKNLFKLHFEIIEHFIEFIISYTIKFEEFLYKSDEKYVINWLVFQKN